MMKVIYLIGALVSLNSMAAGVCTLEYIGHGATQFFIHVVGHVEQDSEAYDCNSMVSKLKAYEDSGICSVDWEVTKAVIPSSKTDCHKTIDSVIAKKNKSPSTKETAKRAAADAGVQKELAQCKARLSTIEEILTERNYSVANSKELKSIVNAISVITGTDRSPASNNSSAK